MMTEPIRDPDTEAAVEPGCAVCGHGESEHAEREIEEAGRTLRLTTCESCGDAHEFVAEPPESVVGGHREHVGTAPPSGER